jgi:hypothetical protein
VNWPSPRSLFEIRSFLGLANYFRRFIQHYAHIAAPLTALLKGADKADRQGRLLQLGKLSPEHAARLTTAFTAHRTTECESAFAQLKQALVQAPVLVKAVIYTPPRPFLHLFTTCKYMFVNTFSDFCFIYFNSFTFTPLFYNVYIVNCKRLHCKL